MKRSAPLRSKPIEAKTSVPLLRKKKCKGCGESFRPLRPMQVACGLDCAREVGKAAAEKAQKKADRARKEKLKTTRDLISEAQIAFNKYCRLRDAGRGCISCGVPLGSGAVGGDADAGHYRSRGAAPHLRFNEDNCHAQCKRCNRYGAGNVAAYRIGLLERIGPARLEALENDNEPVKWTREMLTTIKTVYRAKAKELEK